MSARRGRALAVAFHAPAHVPGQADHATKAASGAVTGPARIPGLTLFNTLRPRRGHGAANSMSPTYESPFADLLHNDPDPTETQEWVESVQAVIANDGAERAHQLLEGMVEVTRRAGAHLPFAPTTEYINTI